MTPADTRRPSALNRSDAVPCFHCGARQTDLERGPSSWRRAVSDGRQVVVCPDCQGGEQWRTSVDACPGCGSLDLARRLGQTVCTECLAVVRDVTIAVSEPADLVTVDAALASDVADAIERALGRA